MNKVKELYKKYEEVINYLIVGGLTTVVSLVTKYLLLFTILSASNPVELQIAVVVSWVCAVAFAYFANRIFVFKSKSRDYAKEVSKFVGGRITTLLIEMFIMWFFCSLLKLNSDSSVLLVTIGCQFLIIILNYFISKFLVFIKKDGDEQK